MRTIIYTSSHTLNCCYLRDPPIATSSLVARFHAFVHAISGDPPMYHHLRWINLLICPTFHLRTRVLGLRCPVAFRLPKSKPQISSQSTPTTSRLHGWKQAMSRARATFRPVARLAASVSEGSSSTVLPERTDGVRGKSKRLTAPLPIIVSFIPILPMS